MQAKFHKLDGDTDFLLLGRSSRWDLSVEVAGSCPLRRSSQSEILEYRVAMKRTVSTLEIPPSVEQRNLPKVLWKGFKHDNLEKPSEGIWTAATAKPYISKLN